MAELKPIIVNNPQKGIAPSSYLGFEEIRNLNITDKPGVAYPHRALTSEGGATVDDLMEKMVKDSTGDIWGYTKEVGNYVFKRNGTWAELTAHTDSGIDGMEYWKSYVAIIEGGTIDWYKISDNSCDTSWSASDITDSGSNPHPTLHSKNDDKLYLGANNVIDTITEDTNFVPATGATYTVVKAAFKLPEGYTIVYLEELGEKLVIGTSKNGNAMESVLFFWDRSSTTYDNIITMRDESIANMIVVDNLLYIQGGTKGTWYVSNGTSTQKIAELPYTLADLSSFPLNVYRNAICYKDGLIYFGVSYNGGSVAVPILGVWSLNPKTSALNYEYTISPGEYGQTATKAVYIGALIPIGGSNPNLLVSWYDENGSAYGTDDIGSARYTSDLAYLVSDFSRVAGSLDKRPLNKWSVQLSKPMASGDSVKVYYRTAQNGSWLNVVDGVTESTTSTDNTAFMSFAVEGASQSKRIDQPIEVENLQVKIVLNDEAELFETRIL